MREIPGFPGGVATARRRKRAWARELLQGLAYDLEPETLPWWVPTSVGVAPGQWRGWWWVPAGAEDPEYIGGSVYIAQETLLERRRAAAGA